MNESTDDQWQDYFSEEELPSGFTTGERTFMFVMGIILGYFFFHIILWASNAW